MSDSSDSTYKRRNRNSFNDDDIDLAKQNNRLRIKLKKLTRRLDDQLEKVGKLKVKQSVNHVHLGSPQSQSLQLQNAYKMIERLQKTVKDFQSKQSYQVSFKRILDLQSIIKKKDSEAEQLKTQLKYAKKSLRDKEKHLKEILEKQAVNPNLNEEKQMISKLKQRIKKLISDNDQLKKKQMLKHSKLVSAERRIINLEQEDEDPIGRSEQLLQRMNNYKKKYEEAMQRIEKQNIYITRLNTKLVEKEEESRKYNPKKRNLSSNIDEKKIAKSVEELPDLNNKNKIKPDFLEHIPSPHVPARILKRY